MNQLPIDHELPPPLDDSHLLNRHRFHYNLAEIHARNQNRALEIYHREIAQRDLAELVLRGVIVPEQYGDVE